MTKRRKEAEARFAASVEAEAEAGITAFAWSCLGDGCCPETCITCHPVGGTEAPTRLQPNTIKVIRMLLRHSDHCDVTYEVLDDFERCYPED